MDGYQQLVNVFTVIVSLLLFALAFLPAHDPMLFPGYV